MKVRLLKIINFFDPELKASRHKENDLLAEFNELVLDTEEYE